MKPVRGAADEYGRSQAITWLCATPCAIGRGMYNRIGALEPTGAVWHDYVQVCQGVEQ